MKQDVLTASDFYRYFQCPHWPYWERFGDSRDRRELTETEERRHAGGLEHEKDVVSGLGILKEIHIKNAQAGFEKTIEFMKQGAPLIYQGWLVDGDWVGRPDLLKREEGESAFGDWYYVPIDIKQAHEMKKEHKAQLTFYATLLERIQKTFPRYPAIINADHQCIPFDASEFMSEFQGLVQQLERIRAGEMPDPVYRKACEDTSPWGKACFRLAKERDDIALLFNVDVKKLRALRALGIQTVEQAAEIDPAQLEGQAPNLTLRALQHVQRQACSLRDQKVIIREPFIDSTKGLEIHFDIESHPPTDTDYLYGFHIPTTPLYSPFVRGKQSTAASPPYEGGARGGGSRAEYICFISEHPKDEEKMWRAFLSWLSILPEDYTVYHYASYEPSRLKILAGRYGDLKHPDLNKFLTRLIDLKEVVREHAVFPLYFYSLKAIGKYLGFSWGEGVQNGGESVDVYDKWRETGDRKLLESIIRYNECDVKATAFLLDWLRKTAA